MCAYLLTIPLIKVILSWLYVKQAIHFLLPHWWRLVSTLWNSNAWELMLPQDGSITKRKKRIFRRLRFTVAKLAKVGNQLEFSHKSAELDIQVTRWQCDKSEHQCMRQKSRVLFVCRQRAEFISAANYISNLIHAEVLSNTNVPWSLMHPESPFFWGKHIFYIV